VVDEFGTIAVEDLNIEGMVKNHRLAKHISDVSWDSFFRMLCCKASSAGGRVLKNPRTRGSTLRCFNGGGRFQNPWQLEFTPAHSVELPCTETTTLPWCI
jgi:putative transposase